MSLSILSWGGMLCTPRVSVWSQFWSWTLFISWYPTLLPVHSSQHHRHCSVNF
jgi:hypothetical protein